MKTLLVKNIGQLVTPLGKSKKQGKEMSDLCIKKDMSILVRDGKIVKIASFDELKDELDRDTQLIDAEGKAVIPGFVDSHTHFVFGGYRDNEFNMRLMGASYMEIAKAGGGINATVTATRTESFDELYQKALKRMDSMLSFGVTTVEGKSGYGLDRQTEIKQLEVMDKLNETHPIDIVKTYMAAHDIPVEFKGRPSDYIDFIIENGLDDAKDRAEFCDIFTEDGVFNIEDSRRLLNAAKEKGFKLKMHADEIVQFGGSELAAEVGAVSADHLLKASDQGIKDMVDKGVIMTLLPSTAFSLKADFARARHMIDEGGAVAVASDYNPGSCHTNSIPLMIALSTIYMGMSIEEVITALTLNGAAAIDKAEEIGSIEVGKKADFIILDAPSYKHLSYTIAVNLVEKVIKNGKLVFDKNLSIQY